MKYTLISKDKKIHQLRDECQKCVYVFLTGRDKPCFYCFNDINPFGNFTPGTAIEQWYIKNAALE